MNLIFYIPTKDRSETYFYTNTLPQKKKQNK